MKIHVSYNNQQLYESTLIFLHKFCNLVTDDYEMLTICRNSFYIEDSKNKIDNVLLPILQNLKQYECNYNNKKIVLYEEQSNENYVIFRSKILSNKKIIILDFENFDDGDLSIFFKHVKQFAINDFKKIVCDYISHYVFSDYHEWEKSDNYYKRTQSTLYLPLNKKENLLNDVCNFYNNSNIANFYKKMNIPQTRVYLFYGFPGTGKTTTSYVIASELNINICTIDFTSKIDDSVFRRSLKTLPDNSILLIEDIDHLFDPKKQHDDMRHAITFSGLLNIIDGISKVKKLICIITCNNIDVLDKTLLRRIDYSVEFSNGVTEEQLISFCDQLPKNIDIDRNKFVKFFKNKETTINIIQKWMLYHLNSLILKKYLIDEKLEEFNKYNNWYQKSSSKNNLYN